MKKIDRILKSAGPSDWAGDRFATLACSLERVQGATLRAVASATYWRAIRTGRRIHGPGWRPAGWWRIADWKPIAYGHVPGPGGWFTKARIGPVRFSSGWGEPPTWALAPVIAWRR